MHDWTTLQGCCKVRHLARGIMPVNATATWRATGTTFSHPWSRGARGMGGYRNGIHKELLYANCLVNKIIFKPRA